MAAAAGRRIRRTGRRAGPLRSRPPTAGVSLPDRGERSQILSPLVRKLAQEHSIDLAAVVGTGTGGRITKSDVMAVVASGAAPGAASGAPSRRAGFGRASGLDGATVGRRGGRRG